jgi:hypothetical protein
LVGKAFSSVVPECLNSVKLTARGSVAEILTNLLTFFSEKFSVFPIGTGLEDEKIARHRVTNIKYILTIVP